MSDTLTDEVYTLEEAAAVLKVSRHVLWRRVKAGDVTAVKVGRDYRIPRDALRFYIGQGLPEELKPRRESATFKTAAEVVVGQRRRAKASNEHGR